MLAATRHIIEETLCVRVKLVSFIRSSCILFLLGSRLDWIYFYDLTPGLEMMAGCLELPIPASRFTNPFWTSNAGAIARLAATLIDPMFCVYEEESCANALSSRPGRNAERKYWPTDSVSLLRARQNWYIEIESAQPI
jgi:hypothetical protein